MRYITDVPWPNIIDYDGVSEITGYKEGYIKAFYRELEIPFFKCAGKVCFREAEVVEWQRKRLEAKRIAAEQAESRYASMVQRQGLGRA